MDYKALFELWLKERASLPLLEIPGDFYISMDGKLAKLYRKSQKQEWRELAAEIIERMEFLRKDLAQVRLSKILNSVIYNVPIDTKVLTWGERRLINNLKKSIEMLGVEIPNILDTQQISPETNHLGNSEVEPAQIEENSDFLSVPQVSLIIRILDDVEAFVGLDNKRYGPLVKHDVVSLPAGNAKALIAKGVARVIETKIDKLISGEKL
ncbi:MAG: DNA replication complex GINS family protein [Candidatus Heimdallarchaeota archaeon]|nr:MAG: DNA replication complex GINS family protein [Candidatus Heimdallarchaeota archaeon]